MAIETQIIPESPAAHCQPSPREEDFQLLRRYADLGDPQAFAQIVQRYAAFVYSTCLRVVGSTSSAEDLAQETFFRLMRRPHEIHRNLGCWLHRTATHLAVDALRSDSSRRRREINYMRECAHESSTWAELSPAVDQALSDMPEEFRTLLVKHFLLGQSQADMAIEMNQSPSTVSRRMQHALDELRQHLRLKGVYALPAALAGLLCHVASRQAPASLVHELGKMAMVSGATAAARTAQFGSPDPRRLPPRHLTLTQYFSPQVALALAGMAGAMLILRLLMNLATLSDAPPANPDPEPPRHVTSDNTTAIRGSDGLRQLSGVRRGAVAEAAPQ